MNLTARGGVCYDAANMSERRLAPVCMAAKACELARCSGAPANQRGAFYFYFYFGSVNADCDARVGA